MAGRATGGLADWLRRLVFTSSSGVRAYGSAMFSVHMAEHMTLNMFIPVLLVLGGPVTLALRVLPAAGDGQPPGPREWLTWLVHSRVTAFFSHPITAFVLFVASPYIVYFTPIFDTLVRYHWGHEFMACISCSSGTCSTGGSSVSIPDPGDCRSRDVSGCCSR